MDGNYIDENYIDGNYIDGRLHRWETTYAQTAQAVTT